MALEQTFSSSLEDAMVLVLQYVCCHVHIPILAFQQAEQSANDWGQRSLELGAEKNLTGSTWRHHRAWPWWHGRRKCSKVRWHWPSMMNWLSRARDKTSTCSRMTSRMYQIWCSSWLRHLTGVARNDAYMWTSVILHMKSLASWLDET